MKKIQGVVAIIVAFSLILISNIIYNTKNMTSETLSRFGSSRKRSETNSN